MNIPGTDDVISSQGRDEAMFQGVFMSLTENKRQLFMLSAFYAVTYHNYCVTSVNSRVSILEYYIDCAKNSKFTGCRLISMQQAAAYFHQGFSLFCVGK